MKDSTGKRKFLSLKIIGEAKAKNSREVFLSWWNLFLKWSNLLHFHVAPWNDRQSEIRERLLTVYKSQAG